MRTQAWALTFAILVAPAGSIASMSLLGFQDGTNCPTCFQTQFGPGLPAAGMPSPWGAYSQAYPWWAYYGAYSYPNFYSPGAWTGWGMNPRAYPGGGPIYAAKPNLYFEGPPSTQVELKVQIQNPDDWSIAVPPYHLDGGGEGWKVSLDSAKHSPEGSNVLLIGGSRYRFIYYDYRLGLERLQNTQGFCADREGVLEKMDRALLDLGFAPNERADFSEQWSVKLPKSERYCIYPQLESALDHHAKWTVTPKPDRIVRVLFVCATAEALTPGKLAFFSKPPAQDWVAPRVEREPAGVKSKRKKSPLMLREWGVGFLMANPD